MKAKIAAALLGVLLLAPSAAVKAEEVPASRAEITLSFAPVVKRTAPAVVNVYAQRRVAQQGFNPFGDDPFFRRFFGEDGFFGAPRERVQNSLGSGVIVDAQGLIVTNNHVIKGGTDIRVVLSDKREFEAKVVLTDERTDLAILKINPGSAQLPSLPFGDSDALEVGDLVLAIGNPFGVGQTVTSGIVSALSRTQVGITDYQFFIQTDAAINPGNSGGALIDMAGRLVGINTAIFSRSGGSIGIGFAIPVNMVAAVVRSAETGGTIVRPWSGADVQDVTAEIAESLGFDRPQGALVTQLHKTSPLAKAGLKRGDVVIDVNGRPIEDSQALSYRLATASIGETADLTFLRGGERIKATIQLVAPPEEPARQETVIDGANPFAGIVAWNLSPATADELGLGTSTTGVAVADVKGGPAARVGFRKGDVLLEINGKPIDSVKTLTGLLAGDERFWDFSISRGGRTLRMQLGG
ncbi:MAG: DegQ family serine endoprotease [Parvibaculaceae bacterium]